MRRFIGGLLLFAVVSTAAAQIAPARTWPELKQATQERVDGQRYPLTGFNPVEVREILGRINSLDRDEWARSWIMNGDRHMAAASALPASDRRRAEAYLAAWRYYSFGAWPTQNSPEKKRAQRLGSEAFQAYARTQPNMEVMRIPFEGAEIVAYLQRPPGDAKPPVVISVGGLDSYKEFVAEQYGPTYIKAGLAYVAIDMPGTGDSPLRAAPGSERIFVRVIDELQRRTDVDGSRIGFQGVSWGGHWAYRMAYAEPQRVKAVVSWGGPLHAYFQRDWQLQALGTREYLFDLFQARASVYGVESLDDFLLAGPKLSIRDQIDKPTPAMLLVNGEKDTQVPIDDLYLALRSGSPKEAWVNPQGGHLGRGKDWPDGRILNEVITPWLAKQLRVSPGSS
jgi:pimeloyl-ACP methyl ester carboxylesterase